MIPAVYCWSCGLLSSYYIAGVLCCCGISCTAWNIGKGDIGVLEHQSHSSSATAAAASEIRAFG